jgi:hypothetical protein
MTDDGPPPRIPEQWSRTVQCEVRLVCLVYVSVSGVWYYLQICLINTYKWARHMPVWLRPQAMHMGGCCACACA